MIGQKEKSLTKCRKACMIESGMLEKKSYVKSYRGIIFEIADSKNGFKVFDGINSKFVNLWDFSKLQLVDKVDCVKDYIDEIPLYGL